MTVNRATGSGLPAHSRSLRWLTPALLGCLGGTAWQLQQPVLWPLWVYMAFMPLAPAAYALVAIKIIAIKRSQWLTDALLAGLFGLLALGLTGARASLFAADALDAALQGRDVAVVGMVVSMPQPFELGQRFRFEPESAALQGQPLRLPERLELAWYGNSAEQRAAVEDDDAPAQHPSAPPQAGERWQFTVRLKAVHGSANPDGFDFELWQWEQGVQATGYVRNGRKDPPPQRLELSVWQSLGYPIERLRQQVRERIFQQVADPNAAGLIAALVVGDQRAIQRQDWDVFRATGVAHLMSISGLHITMFAWLAARVVGRLWRRSARLCRLWPAPSAALAGGVLLALLYALFSGWGVPAQRTVLMLTTVGLLRLGGLRWPWPQVWLLTCAVVVLMDPWALLQAGFWLSFVAVGVLFASDSGADSARVTGATGRLASMFHEQWVITLALTPLSLVLFGQVSLVGLLGNALAVPWVTLLITPLAMLGTLWPAVWDVVAWAVLLMLLVLRWLADWPWAVVTVAQAPGWAAIAGVLGGVLLVLRLPPALRLSGLPLLLPVLLWQPARPPAGGFELLAVDVGQGTAVLVRTAQHALLYDTGPRYSADSNAGQRVLVPLLRALGVQLDTLLLSHRDSDHSGGASAVLTMQPQAALLSSFDAGSALAAHQSAQRCVAGQRWQWDGVDFELLHPQTGDYALALKTNAMSCVLRISNGQHTALLTGDIEQAQEAALVQRQPTLGLKADVLLAPHHGSQSSSSAVFLDAVQPRIILVQAGYRNRFGHPAGPVLVRYADRQVQVLDTPHCGAVTWQSWQADTPQCQRQRNPHYWQHRF